MRNPLLFVLVLLLVGPIYAGSETPVPPVVRQETQDVFAKGSKEFQSVAGLFYFFDRGDNDGPSIDLAVASLRLGTMLSNRTAAASLQATMNSSRKFLAAESFKVPATSKRARLFSCVTTSSNRKRA